MLIEYLPEEDRTFEPFLGEYPYAIHDRHPAGRLLAMRVINRSDSLAGWAAVWDAATKRVVWRSDGVNALRWLPDGREALLAREPPLLGAMVERFTWPANPAAVEPRLLGVIPDPTPFGYVRTFVPSPAGGLAAVVWTDQSEGGVELVSWADDAPLTHLDGCGYFGSRSGTLNTPTFSPDGRYLVLVYGNPEWWTGEEGDPDEPSPGGTFCCGWAVVGDVARGVYTEHPVEVTVPPGWAPEDPYNVEWDYLPSAAFTGDAEFIVPLPTGGSRRFHVTTGPIV